MAISTQVSYATAQGARADQQDRCVCARIERAPFARGLFMAVMDGHGGSAVAELTAKNILPIFEQTLEKREGRVEEALCELVRELATRAENEPSGSSLSVTFIPDPGDRAYTAVLGDSPVIIRATDDHVRLGPLHNARASEPERAAAIARGAVYLGGYLEDPALPGHGLQLSRALGDRGLARIISREPEIFHVDLGKSSFVLLATDGIFAALETGLDDQVSRLVEQIQSGADAQALVQDALRRHTQDNVTVVLWRASE